MSKEEIYEDEISEVYDYGDFSESSDEDENDVVSHHQTVGSNLEVEEIEETGRRSLEDLRSLGSITTFEDVVYQMYRQNYSSDVVEAVLKFMISYESETNRSLNLKACEKISRELKLLEEADVTHEEAYEMMESSYYVENTYYQKIKVFISQRGAKHAIVGNDGMILYSDSKEVSDFVDTRLSAINEYGMASEHLTNWVSAVRNSLDAKKKGEKNHVTYPLVQRLRDSPSPLNQYIASGEMDQIRLDIAEKARRVSEYSDKGVKTSQHFSIKVTTEHGSQSLSVMSNQLISQMVSEMRGYKEERQTIQVTFGASAPEETTVYDEVETWTIAEQGTGSEKMFDPKATREELEDETREVPTKPAMTTLLNKIKTQGIVRTSNSMFLKTQWNRKLNMADIEQGLTMGYVGKEIFAQVAKAKKTKSLCDGVDPRLLQKNYVCLLIDPFSQLIVAIPKAFLIPKTSLRTVNSRFGVKVTPGLLGVLNFYSTVFMTYLTECDDWNNIEPDGLVRALGSLKKISTKVDEDRFVEFAEAMSRTLNSLEPRVLIVAGSKKSTDHDVHAYMTDKEWVVDNSSDDDYDEGDDSEISLDDLDY